MNPTTSQAINRPDLGATMEEFDLEASRLGFVGLRLMPVIEVAEQSADIGIIPIEELLKDADTRRQSTGGYSRSSFTFGEFFYATSDHGHEVPVDDRLKRIYRRYFESEVVATKRARDVVLRSHERRVCTKLTTNASFTNAAAAVAWSTAATATPITDVLARKLAVRNACGMMPNTIAMDWETAQRCRETAQIIDRIKYSGRDDPKSKAITAKILAEVFDVEEVVIAGGQRNTATQNESATSATLSSLWDKTKVGVGYVPRTNDVAEPGVGRTFHWSADGSSIGTTVETYRDERTRGDVVRARFDVDERVHYAVCWQLITGVL